MTSSLSFSDLEKLWVAQGGSPQWSPTMAGIALAESGGEPTNQYRDNPSPPYGQPGSTQNTQNATGLWQIMPSNYPDQSIPQLEQPDTNAADAVALAGGKGQTNVGAVTSNWDPSQDPVTAAVAAQGGPLTAAQVQAVLASSGRSTGGSSSSGGTTISLESPFGSGELLPGGAWDPLNWGTMAAAAASNALWNALLPYIIILLGLVFVVVGIAVTFRGHDTLKLTPPAGSPQPQPQPEAPPRKQHHVVRDTAEVAAVGAMAGE
jgi:hypothetical protein